MILTLFESQEQVMIRPFLIKLTEFEKTGLLGKIFIPLQNLKTKFHLRNKIDHVFCVLYTLLLL